MLIFRQEVATTRLKSIWHWIIHSGDSNNEQVFMNWDTDSFIDFFFLFKWIYIFLKDLSNEHFCHVRTTSKLRHFVRIVISNLLKKNPESCSSSLAYMLFITAYNSFKV